MMKDFKWDEEAQRAHPWGGVGAIHKCDVEGLSKLERKILRGHEEKFRQKYSLNYINLK